MASPAIPQRQLFIDGEWRAPALGRRLPVINPTTEASIGEIPAGTSEDVDAAVAAARAALKRNRGRDWSRATGAVLAKYLRAIAAKMIERKSDLARLEALDCGKPLEEAAWDMDDVAGCFEFFAGHAEALDKRQNSPVTLPENFKCHLKKEPIGVVGLITPWNYPLLMATWKVAPALAAGCTAVLKPSELASVTCLELADVCKEVGLPPGVLNIVTGLGAEAGAPLSSHPDVDKVSFTGSYETGKKIMIAAAPTVKPVTLELGGKSPIVVFDDVDIDKAVEWTLFGCFWTNGQICSATSRLLIHKNIAKEFVDRMVAWSKNIKVSDPLEEGCRLGPVVSEGQYEKIKKFVENARREGATILTGGGRPKHMEKGFFIEPTIITDINTSMEIWREEVFGPVLCVKEFSTEEEAIELANDTHYGLAGAVISGDRELRLQGGRDIPLGRCAVPQKSPQNCRRTDRDFYSGFKRAHHFAQRTRHITASARKTCFISLESHSCDLTTILRGRLVAVQNLALMGCCLLDWNDYLAPASRQVFNSVAHDTTSSIESLQVLAFDAVLALLFLWRQC